MISKAKTYNYRLFLFFFLFTTFSGAVRKWGVSSELIGNLFLGVQLILPLILAVLLKKDKTLPKPVFVLLGTYALCLLAMIFNPLNLTIYHGMLGFVLHFGFWLAAFLSLTNIHLIPLERLLFIITATIIMEMVLGGLQYTLPKTHILNQLTSEEGVNNTHVGDAVRAAGTFSYIGGYGAFIVFAGYFLWGVGVWKRSLPLQVLILVLGLVMSLFSGSRAPTFIFLGLGLVSFLPRMNVNNFLGSLVALILLVVALFQFSDKIPVFSRAAENLRARVERGLESGEQNSRLVSTVEEVINFRGDYPLFGTGLGATYQGAKSIWGESYFVQKYGFYEEEPERIILEGGYLLYLFKIMLVIVLFSYMRIPVFLQIPLAVFHFFFFPIVFNTFNAAYLFLGLVIVERAYYLQQIRRKVTASSAVSIP